MDKNWIVANFDPETLNENQRILSRYYQDLALRIIREAVAGVGRDASLTALKTSYDAAMATYPV